MGDLDHASEYSHRSLELSREVDAEDITGVYWLHQFLIRRDRGGLDTVASGMESLSSKFGHAPHWRAGIALVWWEIGRRSEALGILDDYAAHAFADIPPGMLWLHVL